MTAVLLQVRLDSSRLPGKALLPLAGLPVVVHAMRALREIPADLYALLCPEDSASRLEPLTESEGFQLLTGPKDDVLARYALAVHKWKPDTVIRATGDNPLVSPELACSLLPQHFKQKADYSGYAGIPIGSGVEIIRAESLLRADREAVDPYEREHVAPYLYHHPEIFSINRPVPDNGRYRSDIRITLDTPEDYSRLSVLFSELYDGLPIPLETVIGWFNR